MNKVEQIQNKVFALNTLLKTLNVWRFMDDKIVFTNGCFDLIHLGHIDYLSRASDLGDRLIIGLNSDNSVKKLKGENRPVKDEHSRAMILAAFSFVDAVVIFDEDTPINLIEQIKPDLLVKGGDYKVENIVGYDTVNKYGGEIKVLDFIKGYSSTLIEEKIISGSKIAGK